jgi:hypothetical protein
MYNVGVGLVIVLALTAVVVVAAAQLCFEPATRIEEAAAKQRP